MEMECVRTRSGRTAWRAKAWRVCETGVTYHNPLDALATHRAIASRLAEARQRAMANRLDEVDEAILAVLRATPHLTADQVRHALPMRLGRQELVRRLTRLVARHHLLEYEPVRNRPSVSIGLRYAPVGTPIPTGRQMVLPIPPSEEADQERQDLVAAA